MEIINFSELEELLYFFKNRLQTNLTEKIVVENVEVEIIFLNKLFKEINFYKLFDIVPVSSIEELQKNKLFIKMTNIEQSNNDFFINILDKNFLISKNDQFFIKNNEILKFNL